MSGGSMNYLYSLVDEAANDLIDSGDIQRVAFGMHLKLVARALRSIEWVDSGDYGPGDEYDDIKEVLND